MRVDGSGSANAGADDSSRPPAFQVIVLVCETCPLPVYRSTLLDHHLDMIPHHIMHLSFTHVS